MRYKVPRATGVLLAHSNVSTHPDWPGNAVGMLLGNETGFGGSEKSQGAAVLIMTPTPEHGGYDETVIEGVRIIDDKLRLATDDEYNSFLEICPARYAAAVTDARNRGCSKHYCKSEMIIKAQVAAQAITNAEERVEALYDLQKTIAAGLIYEEPKNWAAYVYPLSETASAKVVVPISN